ncbi:putative Zinc finger protein, partial [Naja naja]
LGEQQSLEEAIRIASRIQQVYGWLILVNMQ